MNYNLECDGVDICLNGTFDCENCSSYKKGTKEKKVVCRKKKMEHPPQKQFKRRKK